MALQYSANVRNNKLDSIETTGGASPILTLVSGAPPATCATANSGTIIATMTLPADWMAAASGGSKAKAGTWQDTSADATGSVGHFRIHIAAGTECIAQGTCTNTGGGGDMTLDNTTVNSGQSITVATFTLTSGNA